MQYSISKYSHHSVCHIPMTNIFYNWEFTLFDSLHPFCPFHYSYPRNIWQPPICSLFLWALGFFLLFWFQIPHGSEIIWHLSVSDIFHLTIRPSGFILLSQMARLHFFFYDWVIFLCVCAHLLYPLVHQWTMRFSVNNAAVNMGVHIPF